MNDQSPDTIARARSHLDALVASSKTPGLQYLVLDQARTVFGYAGGWSDIRRRLPMDSSTTMMAYSMCKTMTAAAVLQLVEAGKVGLDNPVAGYLDSIPYGPGVTVRELLSHTSGVPNPIPLRWVHPAERHATFDESAALSKVLLDHPRLSHPPGTRYAYSNIGYWLLGSIVERASGEHFTSYVRAHVLQPLGVSAQDLGYAIPDPARHATGYLETYSLMNLIKGLLLDRELIGEYAGRWLSIRSHYVNGAAFGGLVGTARGFGRFLQDQLTPHSRLFGDETRGLFYQPQHVGERTAIAMTLGWHVGSLDGSRFYYKEGGGGGFHCMMRVYPAQSIASVVMANATAFDVATCLNDVDRLFLRPS
jgi:CubicO group peptidase (beta-lactamase class C family)